MPTYNQDFPTAEQLVLMTEVMGSISIIALCLALTALFYTHVVRKERLTFHAHLTAVLLCVDLVDCCAMVASRHAYGIPWACDVQGMVLTVSELLIIAWNAFIAHNTYAWLLNKKEPALLKRRINPVLLIISIYSLLNATLFRVFYSRFGPADLWCWFPNSHKMGRIWALHIYLYPATLYITAVVVLVYLRVLRPQRNRVISGREALLRRRMTARFMGYLMAFLVTWGFAIANRIVQLVRPKRVPWLLTLHVLAKPSMGLMDSLVYGSVWSVCKYRARLGRRKHGDAPSQVTIGGGMELPGAEVLLGDDVEEGSGGAEVPVVAGGEVASSSTVLSQSEGGGGGGGETKSEGDVFSIFVTTYNAASQGPSTLGLEDGLHHWLPLGHDLYIIGLQEVKGLTQFRSLVHRHVGGSEAYVMYTQEIGAVLPLGAIALTVLARVQDVASGVVEMTAGPEKEGQQVLQGIHLGVIRAGNKGGVGLPFRIHGSSIAVVVAHLPADGHKSRVQRRDRAVRELFSHTKLSGEPFDLQLLHHHLIFLGDLNYRVGSCGSPEDALQLIAEAARASHRATMTTTSKRQSSLTRTHSRGEGSVGGSSVDLLSSNKGEEDEEESERVVTWLDVRYGGLRRTAGRNPPPSKAWLQLLGRGREELRTAIADGRVLHGFREGPIGFPPSYRRVKGLGCGDYTDERLLRQAYSTRLITGFSGAWEAQMEEGLEDEEEDGEEEEDDGWSAEGDGARSKSSGGRSSSSSPDDEEDDQTVKTTVSIRPPPKPPGMKIRMPSYADRILLHSLPDMAPHLTLQNYELCDRLASSDHRPVSAVLHLNVQATRRLHRLSTLAYYYPLLPVDVLPATARPAGGARVVGGPSLGRSLSTSSAVPSSSGEQQQQQPPPGLQHSLSNPQPPPSAPPLPSSSSSSTTTPMTGVLIVTLRLSGLRLSFSPTTTTGASGDGAPPLPPVPPPLVTCPSSSTSNSGGASVSEAAGGGSSSERSRLLVAFPLPSENLMERSERELEYLHSELGHGWRVWSSEAKDLLRGTAALALEEAAADGVTMSAAVRVGGVLHAVVKVMDGSGQDVAQAVLCLPRPGEGPKQLDDVPLTLHTSRIGSLSAVVEIVKVKIKANV